MLRMLCAGALMVGLSVARADDKKEDPNVAVLKAVAEAQAKELEKLRKQVKELEDERTKLVLDKEKALRELLSAQNDAKLARGVADANAKKIKELTAALQELKGQKGLKERRGEVTRVDGEVIQVDIGADAKIEVGTVLDVIRDDGKGENLYLGTVKLTKVLPKEATGTFIPARNVAVAQLRPNELPRKGDTVCEVSPRK